MFAIGLMSGTSLDGVTASLVEIVRGKFKLVNCITLPYSASFKAKIFRNLNKETAKLDEISSLNFELSDWFVLAIDEVLKGTNLTYKDIKFVASHGQTIWHDPHGERPNTLQIGEASVISFKTGITCISNFRCMDVSGGGEGAPLIPFSEYYLYRSKTKNLVFQNIGGISNLTYIKKNASLDDVVAFDTGVGNIMIDYFMKRFFGCDYDDGGKTAFKGKIIDGLYNYLKQDEFVYRKPPKSTGREQYSVSFMEDLISKFNLEDYENKEDIITTVSEFTAYNISYNYNKFLKDIDLVIVSGGGSHNKYLMKRIGEMSNTKCITGDDFGINSDSKESFGFAVMGYMTLKGLPSNVRSVTGAKESLILGDITIGRNEYKF